MVSQPPNTQDNPRLVTRRRVFYIPGYDPFHPRRYRELYRTESAEQARISGYAISQRAAGGKGRCYGWQVEAHIEGHDVRAEIEVLVWSDLVRDSMSTSIPATYLQLLRTAWVYIGSGALWRLMQLRKGPVIAALYPVAMLLGQLLLAALLIWGMTWGVGVLVPWWIGLGLGAGAAVLLLRWFRAKDGRFFAYYLMHDYAHTARHRGAYPPDLQARLAGFGDRIAQALQGDWDEVLVVGHSSGAHLGVSVLADLHRQGRVPADGPQLSFLSLGQVVPMVSFLPDADQLRRDLHDLSAQTQVPWVDVSAPGDGCAFALCDPAAVTGVAPDAPQGPLILSAAFTQTLSPARWKELRWRFFRLHFQYLCAFDQPGAYDYFRITAGPRTLADRFRGRKPSASRLVKPLSKYRSLGS